MRQTGFTARRKNQAGWSLVELLVVIGIVICLAAVLVPVLGTANKQAQSAKCAANLRQIAIAHQLYRNEHRGNFVPYTKNHGSAVGDGGAADEPWPKVLADLGYVPKDGKVFVCPSLPRETANTRLVASGDGLPYTGVHYGYNFQHLGGSVRYSGEIYTPANQAQIESPGRTLLLMDAYRPGAGSAISTGRYVVQDHKGVTDYLPHARHGGGLNAAFVDGHVEYIKVLDIRNPWHELGEALNPNSLWKRTR